MMQNRRPGADHVHGPDCQHDHDGEPDHEQAGHVHGPDCQHDHDHDAPAAPFRREAPKIGRNDPCFCGSGKKYKKCHGALEA